MPVTLTIKQVPDRIAEKLRVRAAASHRSLQGELMAILEETVVQRVSTARQIEPQYMVKPSLKPSASKVPAHSERMTLAELWERSRRLGPSSKSESAAIVRTLRDERHR